MSMHEYAVEDYGLLIPEEIAGAMMKAELGEEYDEDEDALYWVYETKGAEYIGDFEGEAFKINDEGSDDWNDSTSFDCEPVLYLPIKTYPSLLTKPYNSINEILDEFKEEYGDILPENFDYRGNLRHIVGTSFG